MTLGHRSILTLLTTAVTAAALASPVLPAAPAGAETQPPLPDSIALPDGFQPEGIAIQGRFGYFGSRDDGDIYRANLTNGKGKRISEGPGTASVGLKVGPRDRLYVSGGDAGTVRIVSARTGRILRSLEVSTATSFVNDVVLTRNAAWFTDSAAPKLYRVPIYADGRLPRKRDVRTIRLRGDWEQPAAGEFGANGITESPSNGRSPKALLVVNSTDGTLFRVPRSGRQAGIADRVLLGGASLTDGDGMLLEGTKLFVVRNQLNRVAVIRLRADGGRGTKLRSFTSDNFDVPTTIARGRGGLYLPNARFTTMPTPETTYDVTRVGRG
ncbi:superoxide dismutase [Nocardioides sp.]|uniref:superoxide dismutase n=1 Tax=Nocardioides sp. TaxID=35761 RepID=UPI002724D266|nr:superoxide dismutase [Nocardioides sp.]MDO9456234.1 superoxide dismutase [Nocardioides sp.]